MKKLRSYLHFDTQAFLEGKELQFLMGKPLDPVKTGFEGVAVEIVIVDDPSGDGNDFEKIKVKVPNVNQDWLEQFHKGDEVQIFDVTKATVYGDYQNELSIIAKICLLDKKS